jgi:WhiB family redox-sensing transcriptional regulator
MTTAHDVIDWRSLAACMSADPDLFFPIASAGPALSQAEEAKAVCAGCRVRRSCLEFALATGQAHGVWGGTTEEERQAMRKRTRPGSSPPPAHRRPPARPQRRHRQPPGRLAGGGRG